VKYKSGYKYQLVEDETFKTKFRPIEQIHTDYLHLHDDGTLLIEKGYCWDGPSGPTFDTITFMKGSCLHDALYQLMRMDKLPCSQWRIADRELEKQCLRDGMWSLRAKWVMAGLKFARGKAARPSSAKKVYKA